MNPAANCSEHHTIAQHRAEQSNRFHLFTQTLHPDLLWIREMLKIARVYFYKRQNESYKSAKPLWNTLYSYNNILTVQVELFQITEVTFKP